MPASSRTRALALITIAVSLVPWVTAMYLFYWLDSSGTWNAETRHRGKLSVLLLGSGMLLSFLLHSWLTRRRP